MAYGNLTADGSTDWFQVTQSDVYISANGSLGGGSLALEKRVSGNTYPVNQSSGSPVLVGIDTDAVYGTGGGAIIRLTLSGSTGADVDWQMAAPQILKVKS